MTIGHYYRVPLDRTDARFSWHVNLPGGAWTSRSEPLPAGTILEHVSDGWGPGSDPAMEQGFLKVGIPSGRVGEVVPTGAWGSFPDWLEETTPERGRFLTALRAWLAAGYELIDAWHDGEAFDADDVAPLPPELAPPMSLDEWFAALAHHYEEKL